MFRRYRAALAVSDGISGEHGSLHTRIHLRLGAIAHHHRPAQRQSATR
ncbi:hypothetical protein GUI03_22330 [Xanthomonas citri pv. citri]|uniref:Uncharacterized protein n=1 Tax=Xanthomonas citri pv. citri TaxID=611301 RepID=A0A8I0HE52_XANCI|nr:hypothetical protein [Xanthomonas citri pv. citri]MBD4339346.1 hypothetical protein [Xanthomonas citri pv. citri]